MNTKPNNVKIIPLHTGERQTNVKKKRKLSRRGEGAVAFTLAEVLITLGVIGIVAAMTMPMLIKNYQKKQTVVQLKKAYSELSQALNIAQKDLGMIEDWDFKNFPTPANRAQYFYDNVLKPNLKIAKYCTPSSNDCWADDSFTLIGNRYSNLTNGVAGHNSFITASGYSVYYWISGSGFSGWFFVDLNGNKKPNILGKDIFTFILFCGPNPAKLKIQGLTPRGLYLYDPETNNTVKKFNRDEIITAIDDVGNGVNGCSKTTTGLTCAALIMVDNWEIEDDYPW